VGTGRQWEEERCDDSLVGPSREAIGQAEQAAERASSLAVTCVEKGRRGREVGWAGFGSRMKEREGIKRKRKAFSIFLLYKLVSNSNKV